MSELNPLRMLYVSLNSQLSKAEVKQLKALLADQLKKNELEQLDDATDIFIKLEEKGFISQGNLELLKKLLSAIQRDPLVKEVDTFFRDNEATSPDMQRADTKPIVQTADAQHFGGGDGTNSNEWSSAAVPMEIGRPMRDPDGESASMQHPIDNRCLHRAKDEDIHSSPSSKRSKCSSSPSEIQEQKYPDKDVTESGDTDNMEISHNEPQAKTVNLRKYQMELAEPALEGKNTIICAPTGSGKTITALHIMQYHLAKGPIANRPKRIVFLVNQRPLVEQQAKECKKYLTPSKHRVTQLTGDTTNSSMAKVVKEGYDVIVLTAQILVNALKDNIISSLSVFTMLIFDECHHTQKSDPYNWIMARYRDMKIDGQQQPRPQIIGLTASLGVGKSRTQQQAVEHILKICANLDADKISTVVKNKTELQRFVPVPDEGDYV